MRACHVAHIHYQRTAYVNTSYENVLPYECATSTRVGCDLALMTQTGVLFVSLLTEELNNAFQKFL